MKSLTELPSEHKCHRNFYKMVWGDLTCKECGNKGLLFRKTYEYCPHCKKKYSEKQILRYLSFVILVLDKSMHLYGVGSISVDYHNELPLLGYKWKTCDHSIGFFGPTNHIENLWSVIKRALRYIYRDLTFNLNDLELILKEWENRHNNPDLFYNEDSYLKSACSELFN